MHDDLLTTGVSQAKEDASELLKEKVELEKQKKALDEATVEKEAVMLKKITTVGNYVDSSVPVSNNEVRHLPSDLPGVL